MNRKNIPPAPLSTPHTFPICARSTPGLVQSRLFFTEFWKKFWPVNRLHTEICCDDLVRPSDPSHTANTPRAL
jgi:hypothetical protein